MKQISDLRERQNGETGDSTFMLNKAGGQFLGCLGGSVQVMLKDQKLMWMRDLLKGPSSKKVRQTKQCSACSPNILIDERGFLNENCNLTWDYVKKVRQIFPCVQ